MKTTTSKAIKDKHFILFFDVNDTMYIGDSAKKVDKNTAILKLLAEHYSAVWDETISNKNITYKDFIEHHLAPGNKRLAAIQEQQNQYYNNFLTYLQEKNHALLPEISQRFATISDNLKDGYIPNSFINLLNYLHHNNYKFTIIFRTFGHDINTVKDELARRAGFNVSYDAAFSAGHLTVGTEILQTPRDILNRVQPFEHGAWQDRFADWQAVQQDYSGGKPYPIDFDNDDKITVFFDDNVAKQILAVKPLVGDYFHQQHLQEALIRLGRIVPVNTYATCIDNDYFINAFNLATMSSLKLSHYCPLSEHGTDALDLAIYGWAVQQLNPSADLALIKQQFNQLVDAYDDNERYFHRGLGHPRSLLPQVSQLIYKFLLLKPTANNTINDLIAQFNQGISSKLINESARIQEAQEIIAGFYHDVVHRKGKKPQALTHFMTANGVYQATTQTTPMTYHLLAGDNAEKVEELSCLVADYALQQLGVAYKHILPVLVAIYSTIPFSDKSEPAHLRSRLHAVIAATNLSFTADEIDAAISAAIAVTNRDHGSYGHDSLDEFNQKTWAMMLERNSNLANPRHSIIDEAATIAGFYDFHKQLHHKMQTNALAIFHALKPNPVTDTLNQRAANTLQQDILLQGVQLGSLVFMMALFNALDQQLLTLPIDSACNHQHVIDFLANIEAKTSSHPDESLFDVIDVLSKQGQMCQINGLQLVRGSSNAPFTLQLIELLGAQTLLALADRYQAYQTINLSQFLTERGHVVDHSHKRQKLAAFSALPQENNGALLQLLGTFKVVKEKTDADDCQHTLSSTSSLVNN